MEDLIDDAPGQRASSARTSTWPGTSRSPARRASPAARWRSATTRSRARRHRTSPTARSRATAPDYSSTPCNQRERRATAAARPARTTACCGGSTGTIDRPLLPRHGRLPARRRSSTFDGADRPVPELRPRPTSVDFPFRCTIPRAVVDGDDRRTRRARRSTATACSASAPRSRRHGGNVDAMANEHNFDLLRRGLGRDSLAGRIVGRPADAAGPDDFPKIADRSQQGFVNFMYLGRAMIHPDGLRRRPAFQVDPDGGDPEPTRIGHRHSAAVLRRQQPGRDPRRRADRARAGLQPRRARRAGDELLDPAAAQRRLRRVRAGHHRRRQHARRPLRPLPERARAAADPVADAAALGPRRGQRLRAPHDRRTRCRTRRSTSAHARSPTATTRWPTSPPRSRRGRSAPAC